MRLWLHGYLSTHVSREWGQRRRKFQVCLSAVLCLWVTGPKQVSAWLVVYINKRELSACVFCCLLPAIYPALRHWPRARLNVKYCMFNLVHVLAATSYFQSPGFNGFRYTMDFEATNWNSAAARCRQFGNGELARITSQAEQDFITNNFIGVNLWIGLRKQVRFSSHFVTCKCSSPRIQNEPCKKVSSKVFLYIN